MYIRRYNFCKFIKRKNFFVEKNTHVLNGSLVDSKSSGTNEYSFVNRVITNKAC